MVLGGVRNNASAVYFVLVSGEMQFNVMKDSVL